MNGPGSKIARRTSHQRRRLLACLLAAGLALLGGTATAQQPVEPPSVAGRESIVKGLQPVTGESDQPGQRHNQRSIDLDIRFALDSAALAPEARQQLDELGYAITSESLSRLRFRIAGHTDASGSAQHNLALSAARAASVRDYLIAKFRVDPARLESIGFGKDHLKDPSNPRSGVNRRVEITSIGWTAVTKEAPAKDAPAKDVPAKESPEPAPAPGERGPQPIGK